LLQQLSAAGPGLLLGAVLFLTIPLQVVRTNLLELASPWAFLGASALAFVAFALLTLLLGRRLGERSRSLLDRGLVAAAVFLLLSDLVSPLGIGQLATGSETPKEPLRGVVLELGVLLVLAVGCAAIAAPSLRKVALSMALAILSVDAAQLASLPGEARPGSRSAEAGETPSQTGFQGNVYQITFDAFSSDAFLDALRELDLARDLEGFIFYPRARSNYLATQMSVPSFATGRLFKGETGLAEWLAETEEHTLLRRLADRGFRTTFYSPYNGPWYFPADTVVRTPVSVAQIADLCLLRAAPTALRHEVFRDGRGLFSRLAQQVRAAPEGDVRSYRAARQFHHMLESEARRGGRGELVYGHLMLPHRPYLMTREGRYQPGSSSYREQALLATKLMVELVRTLKQLGRFDSSLLVIHSDHGNGVASALTDANRERTRPLLLIKPPFAPQRQLQVSGDLVQLVDLPAAVLAAVESGAMPGRYAGNPMPARDAVDVHHVFLRREPGSPQAYRIGSDFFSGSMDWYTVDAGGAARYQPPIPVVW
jgi:hypothetical protein